MNQTFVEPPSLSDEILCDTFGRLLASSASILFLDYDGTLAPFQVDRDLAFPYPGVREVLSDICRSGKTRVVMVSGRACEDVERLLGIPDRLEIWGSHGLVRQDVSGVTHRVDLSPKTLAGLAEGGAKLRERGFGEQIEEKPGCLAFHWRGFEDASGMEKAGRSILSPLAAGGGLSLHSFDGGLEVRAPQASKGHAVRTVLSEMGSNAVAAYLGDDVTDEDAFLALGERGLSLLVRNECRKSAAHAWIQPPEELLEFLSGWRRSIGMKGDV